MTCKGSRAKAFRELSDFFPLPKYCSTVAADLAILEIYSSALCLGCLDLTCFVLVI
jgi:hypothetical protein